MLCYVQVVSITKQHKVPCMIEQFGYAQVCKTVVVLHIAFECHVMDCAFSDQSPSYRFWFINVFSNTFVACSIKHAFVMDGCIWSLWVKRREREREGKKRNKSGLVKVFFSHA